VVGLFLKTIRCIAWETGFENMGAGCHKAPEIETM
jgi:hypothetical protein